MINALYLILIIPASIFTGFELCALLLANGRHGEDDAP